MPIYVQEWGYWIIWQLSLVFWGTSILFSILATPTYIPTNSVGGFPFSKPCPEFVICRLFDGGHSDLYEIVPHCSFDLHFSNNWWCWASFHMPVGHLYFFFGKMPRSSVQFLIELFVFLLLRHTSFLCMEIKILCHFVCKYFLLFHRLSFHFSFIVSFAIQKFIGLIRSHSFIFCYYFFCLGRLT